MPRIFHSKDISFAEAVRRYAPGRAAAMKRVGKKPRVKEAALLTPWPFESWAELRRAQEIDERKRKVLLMKHRAGMNIE